MRAHGATPATIAILRGRIHVGLTAGQLEALARAGTSCSKVSRRDIAPVLARRADGATTVAATMLLAHAAGIRVFVTGGIGGVHRGAAETGDVSADLTELGRTPVAVVCAGIKSVRRCLPRTTRLTDISNRGADPGGVQILDIRRTLEYLETEGVAVAGFRCHEMPAFFTRHSGCNVHCRFDSIPECVPAAMPPWERSPPDMCTTRSLLCAG